MKKVFLRLAERPAYVLAGCAVVFLLLGWGQDGINLDSATYAVIARNMAEQGSWFDPHYTDYYHADFAEHPPLVHWVQGLIFLAAEPNDSTARLFGALCTIGCILLVYGIGKEAIGREFGFLAGVVLLLTYNFMEIGNSTLLDVPMTFFELGALYGVIVMWKNGVTTNLSLFTGLMLALAWLSKGVVTAPVWIAIFLTVLIWKREWMHKKRFWLIPLVVIIFAGAHLLLDWWYADSRFIRHYFFVQIGRRFMAVPGSGSQNWLKFPFRFVSLYLPFIAVLPFGIYLAFKKKRNLLLPLLITLAFYILLYSAAGKIYYHYFPPLYALSAPFVAMPLLGLFSRIKFRGFVIGFMFVWVITGVVVRTSGMRVIQIRTPRIYALNDSVNRMLENVPKRDGLIIGTGNPDWDWVAKTAWYWRSDILQVESLEKAVRFLQSDDYAYLLIDNQQRVIKDSLLNQYADRVAQAIDSGGVSIFVPKTLE